MMRITDKLPAFKRSAVSVLDDAIREAARDTLITAKEHAPYSGKGHLRAGTETKRVSPMHWRVNFWEEYARYQEFGGDGKRVVRNYTTGGTGAHYLKNAGDEQATKLTGTLRKHGARARA